MKKFLISLGAVIVYTSLYLLSHKFVDSWELFLLLMLPFLALPIVISLAFFDRKKYGVSLLLSGLFIFALIFIIGADYSRLLNTSLNGFVGLFYGILGIIFLVVGAIYALVESVALRIFKFKNTKVIFLCVVSAILVLIASAKIYTKLNYIYFGGVSAIDVAKIAADKNDPSICEKVRVFMPIMSPPDVRGECLYRLADLLQDKSICEKIRFVSNTPSSAPPSSLENYIKSCEAQVWRGGEN